MKSFKLVGGNVSSRLPEVSHGEAVADSLRRVGRHLARDAASIPDIHFEPGETVKLPRIVLVVSTFRYLCLKQHVRHG